MNKLEEAAFEKDVNNMPYEEYKAWRKGNHPKEPALAKYKSGNTLFLRSLEAEQIYKRLVGILRDENPAGLLIVSIASRQNVPEEFLEICETILLEPAKNRQSNKLFYTYNQKDKIVLSQSSNSKHGSITLTEQEGKLVSYLAKDRRSLREIIEHIWEVCKKIDVRKKKSSVRELRDRVNKKCAKLGVETLISEQIEGYYQLTVELEEY